MIFNFQCSDRTKRTAVLHHIAGMMLVAIVAGGILVLAFPSTAYSWQAAKDTVRGDASVKRMLASPADPGSPEIDGKLDDPCWRSVDACDDFIQQAPNEGAVPAERTAVRVIYDHKGIYVAVRAFDSAPDKIQAQQRRRDDLQGLGVDDGIMITIDSYHDHQTGYEFRVNPKGSKIDYYCFKDVEIDLSWDGIWDVATSVDSLGWTAEFCIPFSSLRFPKGSDHTWGFNVSRYIAREKEGIQWQLMTKAGTGYISRLGHLAGLEGLSPEPALEFFPFLVNRATFEPKKPVVNPDGRDLSFDMGLDMKYNVRSDVVLNAAVNPDFGQVEADPSILNLTAFETFYPEKRPFFTEGTTIFDTPLQLFYSRRVGKRPGEFQMSPSDQVIKYPDFTTILFAGKLTGKTEKGTAIGFIEAVTAEEHAKIDSM